MTFNKKTKHVVAAGDRTTAEAAQRILESGGNAFDAAVAAVFTAMVAEPGLTSAGGGGHFLAVPAVGEPILFDFFVDMPRKKFKASDLDFLSVNVDFGSAQQEFHIGRAAAGVPGNIAGLLQVQQKLGSLPRKEVLLPAIEHARDGVILSKSQAYLVKILSPILTSKKKGVEIFSPQGSLLKRGDRLTMSEFADFLDTLATEGSDLVYHGEVAKIILDWAKDGGLLTQKDLESYKVHERHPLKTRFYETDVLLNPPPAQSGVLIDVTLSLLERLRQSHSAPFSLEKLISALAITNKVRHDLMPHGLTENLTFPLSQQDGFEKYVQSLQIALASQPSKGPSSLGSTTHVSVIDKAGNTASVTTTNGEGCGSFLPKSGFMLNNMLGEQDLNPLGFHRYTPGTRLPSMISPTTVLEKGRPLLVTGSGGSNRIRSVIVQILVNFLCHGMDIKEATEAPRVHLEGNVLHLEPGISENDLTEMTSPYTLHIWDRKNLFFGGAHSVTANEGAGDARRGGVSLVF